MKQEKGITLVSLFITIIILIIIVGLSIHSISPFVGKANAEDLTTELMLIQAKWKIEREKVNFDGTSSLSLGIVNQDGEEKGKLREEYKYDAEDKPWAKEEVTYYQLPQQALKDMGLEELDTQEGYIVNYEDDEIVYAAGFDGEKGKKYYTLSEIKEL